MSRGSFRVGIVGAGGVVEHYHLPVVTRLPNVTVRWIADPSPERARAMARTYGIAKAVGSWEAGDDVDAVLIATPVGVRPSIAEGCASRGWHLLCEKPYAPTVAEHDRMLEAVRRAGKYSAVGLLRRYYSSTRTARRVLEAGLLGPIEQVIAGEGLRARRTGRGGDWYQSSASASGGGVLFEAGSHLVDQMFTLAGARLFELSRCRQIQTTVLEGETRAGGTLTLLSGNVVPFGLVVSRLHDVYNGIVIRCRHGELRVGLAPDASVELRDRSGKIVETLKPEVPDQAALYDAVRREWEHFLEMAESSDQDLSQTTGRLTTAFIEACYTWSRTKPASPAAEART